MRAGAELTMVRHAGGRASKLNSTHLPAAGVAEAATKAAGEPP